jgi:hypothetical protein
MAGRLYRMAKVVSANPASWGIVDANQISGFRTVATQADLYSIAACVLSSSYGDGTTTGADAVGQIWHVQESNEDYRLINWASRGKAAGWEKVPTADEIITVVSDEITPILEELKEKDETFENNLNSVTSDLNSFKTDSDAKFESLNLWSGAVADKLNTFGLPNGFATLDTKGFIPLSQLGNLDTTLFEVVTELPSTIATIKKHIYLKAVGTTGDKNNYAEYIYTGDLTATYDATKWEKLGEVTASFDLSGYYTKTDADKKIASEINKHRIETIGFVPATDGSSDLQLKLTEYQGANVGPTTIPTVTTNTNGLMSPTLLTKLNGIADGATRNTVVNKVESTGTDAVSGKAVYDAINTHKLTNSNLSSTAIGNTYSILGECDSETNEVGTLVDSLTYQYSADHSTLSIDGAAVWDESTLRAISNDELTKILI